MLIERPVPDFISCWSLLDVGSVVALEKYVKYIEYKQRSLQIILGFLKLEIINLPVEGFFLKPLQTSGWNSARISIMCCREKCQQAR
jgi:hypothetical protein